MKRTVIWASLVGVCLLGVAGAKAKQEQQPDQQPRHARAIAPKLPTGHEHRLLDDLPGRRTAAQQPPAQQPPPSTSPAASTAAPAQPTARVWLDVDGKPLPFKTDEEVMDFLRTAKIVKMKDIPVGVARPREALLEKDGIRARAKFSSVHEEKDSVQLAGGQREFGFRDDAIFDCAAQEIGKLLGMDNLPPVVQRSVGGEKGILQIWVENVMTEKERLKNKIPPPDARRWNDQVQTMRFFDNLVYNTDRNAGNILIDKGWKIWLIDHTRAFRKYDSLLNANAMVVIDRGIWEKLQALDDQLVKDRLKPYLRGFEIEALLNRRKKIIEHYRNEIAKRGESEVIREGK